LNTLGSFIFELCCGQTDELENPSDADRHSRRGGATTTATTATTTTTTTSGVCVRRAAE